MIRELGLTVAHPERTFATHDHINCILILKIKKVKSGYYFA